MKTGVILTLALICVPTGLYSQQTEESILVLSGASSMEELGESGVERFEKYLARPLEINNATRKELMSSGLFSNYQVASLLDYISESGDILSLSELSLVDGFGEAYVQTLKEFISLASFRKAGESRAPTERHLDFQSKLSTKGNNGAKIRISRDESISAALSYKSEFSGNLTYRGRRKRLSITAGDYYARFSQGLAVWSGFDLSSYSSISAFSRKGTGISPAWTYSPGSALRGVAVDYQTLRRSISSICSFSAESVSIATNCARYWKNCQIDVTGSLNPGSGGKASIGGKAAFRKADLFSEICTAMPRMRVDAVCGAIYNFSYDVKFAATGKFVENEASCALGIQVFRHFASFEMEEGQAKFIETSSFNLAKGLVLKTRLACKWKSTENDRWRYEARAVASWEKGNWGVTLRSDAVYCANFAQLHYIEGFRKSGKTGIFLRMTGFSVKSWPDRIYVYERNAPGNFSVPAYHGTGFGASIYAYLKYKHSKFYLRAEYMDSTRKSNDLVVSGSYAISF